MITYYGLEMLNLVNVRILIIITKIPITMTANFNIVLRSIYTDGMILNILINLMLKLINFINKCENNIINF
jgi:hypothetical protein